jgi:predicted nucleic acid-binding protein
VILLDTNVISELVRSKPSRAVLDWLDALDTSEVATTAITVAELLYGVARLPDGRRKSQLETAIEELIDRDLAGRIQPLDAAAARHYAQLVNERERAGKPVSAADAQIASICHALKATLATRNTGDFEGVGVELIDPWQFRPAPPA